MGRKDPDYIMKIHVADYDRIRADMQHLLDENKRLRGALESIADNSCYCGEDAGDMHDTAVYALKGED